MAVTIDEVLDILHRTGPEFGGSLANHGPMAAEALFALQRPDAVVPWVEHYKNRLQDRPARGHPIAPEDWREVLGNISRVGDWGAFFDRQLTEASWQDVVQRWVPQLTPALISAATHRLIRTSHAVRSLVASDTPQRLHELAQVFALGRHVMLQKTGEARAEVVSGVTSLRPERATPERLRALV
jgi:hypothetical protein